MESCVLFGTLLRAIAWGTASQRALQNCSKDVREESAYTGASQVALVVKNAPPNAGHIEMQAQSLGRKDPLEQEMAAHCSIFAWRTPVDRGAWCGTVHAVTGSWTPRKELHTQDIQENKKQQNKIATKNM